MLPAPLHWRLIASALAVLTALAGAAALADPPEEDGAPSTPATPDREYPPLSPLHRIAASFDFEEPDNPYPVPQHWVYAQDTERSPRPGFPRFNQARFDFKVAHSGGASIQLPTSGGSTSLRLTSGVIPVFAGGDYQISAWVRTSRLAHARAFLVARLLDQTSKALAGTDVRSDPVVTHDEQWELVTIHVLNVPETAAFMQLDLELCQPREYLPPPAPLPPASLPPAAQPPAATTPAPASAVSPAPTPASPPAPTPEAYSVTPEDLTGAAWFDDISIHQLPRVEITTGAPANIVLTPERPSLRILVRDFVGERLDGTLVLTDVDGHILERVSLSLATAGRPQEWAPKLPALGWYHVTLDVMGERPTGGSYRVGGAELSFLWIKPPGNPAASTQGEGVRRDRDRFGLIADHIEPALLPAVADVGRRVGTGFATIPLWHADTSVEELTSGVDSFGSLLDSFAQAGQRITVCIPSIPRDLAHDFQILADDPFGLADIEDARWLPYLHPALDRFGQRLTRWQIGRAGSDAVFWRPSFPSATKAIQSRIAALVPGPRLSVPWRAEYALPPGLLESAGIASITYSYPTAFGSESLNSVLNTAIKPIRSALSRDPGSAQFIFVPELPDTRSFGERAEVIEFARRTIEYWAFRTAADQSTLPLSLALDHPWRAGGATHRAQLLPAASLGALRTLADHLCERRVVGEYPLTPGVKCYILADLSAAAGSLPRGALVAWNESADPARAVLSRYLGDGPIEVVDIFGNRAPVERTTAAGGPHAVPIPETPVFIEGVDPMLALFCTQLSVDPAFLPAVQTEHELNIVVSNPWPQAITGKLQIIPPGGAEARHRWSITPDGIVTFSLGAHQTKRIPFNLAFPFYEETGQKEFGVVVRLATDRELPPILLPLTLRVGLQDLALDPDVQLGPRLDGPDVVITANVTNRGVRSRMLKLEAVAAGIPTQQTIIPDLPPGEVVIKRIVLKGMASRLTGQKVHISLADADDQERLNLSVRVP